jgi:tetratricopeptide (TPR) repeat protein
MRLRFAMLFSAAALLSGPAHAKWWEARTDHFIVYSEGDRTEVEQFARSLERYDMAMRSVQKIPADNITSDSQRPTVFRTGKQVDIARLAGSSESGIAGFYLARAGGSLAFVPAHRDIRTRSSSDQRTELNPETVLFHEYAHYFMLNHFPATYPAWYVEGFAEFYGNIDLHKDGQFHLGNPPQYRGYDLFHASPYPVRGLFDDDGKPDMEDVYARYSMGWLLTHYLTFSPDRTGQLKTYLGLINKGRSNMDAASEAFGDFGELDSDLRNYLRGKLPGFLVKPPSFEPPKVGIRALTDEEEGIIKLRMRSKRGVDRDGAVDVLSDVRDRASLLTRSPLVALTLAEAEFDMKNWDAATAAAKHALTLDPKSAEADIFLARIEMEKAKLKQGSFDEARRLLKNAQTADPDNPLPYYITYMSYVDEGVAPPAQASNQLENAYDLAPYDNDIRLRLVRNLLLRKEGALAGEVMTPIAFGSHGSSKEMREVAHLIKTGKLDEAGSKLDEHYAKEKRERDES